MPQLLEQKPTQARAPEAHRTAVPPVPDHHARPSRKWLWIVALLAIAVAAVAVWRMLAKPAAAPYVSAQVQRTDIARTISATGKVQAVTTVQVGTQVSGTVSQVFVDYNSPVKKGQVIAQLDPSQLQAQLTQARAGLLSAQAAINTTQASLAGAQAAVEAAQANVDRLQSAVDDAQLNYKRTQELFNEKLISTRELETARAALNQALAQKQQGVAQLNQARTQVASSRSQLAQAQAQVGQQRAQVDLASVNLGNTVIKAPIDGVIVARSVEPGQTVAASFNTPQLFLIANDLSRMQVLADIDEADVGQLNNQSKVEFTVDAFPTETFEGRISQIRLAPQVVQNVTTYTAVIDVDNPKSKLLPGMTANVTATTASRENVLAIPNAALRFRPADQSADAAPARKGFGGPTVWRITAENKLEPVKVRLGITNGTLSEVVSGDLREGDHIAVGSTQADARPQATGSPLTPGRRGGGRR